MANSNDIVVLGLNKAASKKNIDKQLTDVLASVSEGKASNIVAGLNVSKSKQKIQNQLSAILKGLTLDVSLNTGAANKVAQKQAQQWKQIFKDSVKDLTAPNVDLKPLNAYYKSMEKQGDAFNRRNLNGIDAEIKKREEASRRYSAQLKAQMEQAARADKASITNDTLATNAKKTQQELLNMKHSVGAIAKSPELSAKWQQLFDASKVVKTREELTNLNAKFALFRRELEASKTTMAQVNSEGQSFGNSLAKQLERFGVYFSASAIMLGTVSQIKNMISSVVELDKQLVNIQMVTGGTREETAKLLMSYNEMGKELGATTVQVATSANEFLRQGKSVEETNQLIKASMVLSKVSMLDSASSTAYLTSAMKGMKVATSDVMSIVDKVSKIDQISATSSSGLMLGMSRVANFAREVGYSMDKLLATLAVVGEVTQKDMSEVGNSMRTIFARMSNIKIGKLIDDETNESLGNVESSLAKVGIHLRKSETEFKNYGDVMDEVASKWSGFNDIQKKSIAASFAGKKYARNYSNIVV